MNVLITVKAATGDSKVTYTINRENNITAFASCGLPVVAARSLLADARSARTRYAGEFILK